uniref:Uncharacterized protein n=1 Tax=Plectus sambesii TaxID=2011161 RepID=A0A914WYA4_9BILA
MSDDVQIPSTSGRQSSHRKREPPLLKKKKHQSNNIGWNKRRHERCFGLLHCLANRQLGRAPGWPYPSTTSPVAFSHCLERNGLRRNQQLMQKDVLGHHGCVNAIEFSRNDERFLASGGDDKRIFIWSVTDLMTSDKPKPHTIMEGEHMSNIFCVGFSSDTRRVWSAGNDTLVLLHDVETKKLVDVWRANEAVYGLSIHPSDDNLFMTAAEDGKVHIWDVRTTQHCDDALLLASSRFPMQSAMFNPVDGRLVATANAKDGVQLYDVRRLNKVLMQYEGRNGAMCVRWDGAGNRLLALRLKAQPVLYNVASRHPIAVFDHPGYYNSCTMKSCSFAGPNDEYAIAGSDDWNLYLWRCSTQRQSASKSPRFVKTAHSVLAGHRSIVNQVRYSVQNHLIASSGVEKIVKVWSPWSVVGGRIQAEARKMFTTNSDGVLDLLNSDLVRSHRSHEPGQHAEQEEDFHMLAFFDALVQREIEQSESSSDDDDSDRDFRTTAAHPSYCSEIPPSSSSSEEDDAQNRRSSSHQLRAGSSSSNSSTRKVHKVGATTATELIIRKRQRAEMEESRLARKRGRFSNELIAVSSTAADGGEAPSARLTSGEVATQNPRNDRLRRLRLLAVEGDTDSDDHSRTTPSSSTSANSTSEQLAAEFRRQKSTARRAYRERDSSESD